METVASFWRLLEQNGYCVEEPRPRLEPALEQAIEEEMQEEETLGESEPESVPELPATVRLIRKGDSRALLYVLANSFDHGLWGVGVAEIDELKQQPLPWALVLLDGSGTRGHWFAGQDVKRQAAGWSRIAPGGPNYQVRDPEQMAGARPFANAAELIQSLDRLVK